MVHHSYLAYQHLQRGHQWKPLHHQGTSIGQVPILPSYLAWVCPSLDVSNLTQERAPNSPRARKKARWKKARWLFSRFAPFWKTVRHTALHRSSPPFNTPHGSSTWFFTVGAKGIATNGAIGCYERSVSGIADERSNSSCGNVHFRFFRPDTDRRPTTDPRPALGGGTWRNRPEDDTCGRPKPEQTRFLGGTF